MSRNANNTLFVTDLPARTTESLIREHFEPFGLIQNIQLTPKPNGASAKISYSEHDAAERALSECNYRKINGREIHISWHRHKSQRSPDSDNALQITGLPPSIDDAALHKKLQEFGAVQRCRISHHTSGGSTGRATVFFDSNAIADDVLTKLSGQTLFGRRITVTKYVQQQRGSKFAEPVQEDVHDLPPVILQVQGVTADDLELGHLREIFEGIDQVIQLLQSPPTVLAVFDDPQTVARLIADAASFPRLRLSQQSTTQGIQISSIALEQRTVFVAGFQIPPDDILSHLSTVGPIASFDLIPGPSARVRFQHLASRSRALETLHRTIPNGQKTPISVLPFFDRTLPHRPAGLLQLNELPHPLSTRDLRTQFSRFGPIYAVAISPSAIRDSEPFGFVLFQNFADAATAKSACGFRNILLFPQLDPIEIIFGFMASDSAPDNCVKVWDRDMARFPDLRSIVKGSDGITYGFFSSAAGAALAFESLSGKQAELLNNHAFSLCVARLGSVPLPVDWNYALLHVQGLNADLSARAIREAIERLGVRVEAAFPNLFPGIATGRGNGTILVSTQAEGAFLIEQGHGQYLLFSSRGGYNLLPLAQQRYQFPPVQQGQRRLSAREWMKQFALLNFPDCHAELDSAIKGLSVNETWELVGDISRFTKWIDEFVAKIKLG
jgi:RNA recognition motif-containing protein